MAGQLGCTFEISGKPLKKQLERFQAKWKPVRVKKMRQIKNLEPRFDFIEADPALVGQAVRHRTNPVLFRV
jgi:hypothetical protein